MTIVAVFFLRCCGSGTLNIRTFFHAFVAVFILEDLNCVSLFVPFFAVSFFLYLLSVFNSLVVAVYLTSTTLYFFNFISSFLKCHLSIVLSPQNKLIFFSFNFNVLSVCLKENVINCT